MKLTITQSCDGMGIAIDDTPIDQVDETLCWEVVRLLLTRKEMPRKMESLINNIASVIEPDDEEFTNAPCESCGEWFYRGEYRL